MQCDEEVCLNRWGLSVCKYALILYIGCSDTSQMDRWSARCISLRLSTARGVWGDERRPTLYVYLPSAIFHVLWLFAQSMTGPDAVVYVHVRRCKLPCFCSPLSQMPTLGAVERPSLYKSIAWYKNDATIKALRLWLQRFGHERVKRLDQYAAWGLITQTLAF